MIDKDEDGKLLCHVCGRGFHNLGSHSNKHGTFTEEYKAYFGLAGESLKKRVAHKPECEAKQAKGRSEAEQACVPDMRGMWWTGALEAGPLSQNMQCCLSQTTTVGHRGRCRAKDCAPGVAKVLFSMREGRRAPASCSKDSTDLQRRVCEAGNSRQQAAAFCQDH